MFAAIAQSAEGDLTYSPVGYLPESRLWLTQALDRECNLSVGQFLPFVNFRQVSVDGKEPKLPLRAPTSFFLWELEMDPTEEAVDVNEPTRYIAGRLCHRSPK